MSMRVVVVRKRARLVGEECRQWGLDTTRMHRNIRIDASRYYWPYGNKNLNR